jgi:hypothetical protein
MREKFAAQAPGCPPAVQFTCPDMVSAECQQVRIGSFLCVDLLERVQSGGVGV